MGNSVYLAKLIGPVLLAVGDRACSSTREHYRAIAEEVLRSTMR